MSRDPRFQPGWWILPALALGLLMWWAAFVIAEFVGLLTLLSP